MTTPFPISPAMGRRNHTLAPSTLSQIHASPRSASPHEGPLMNRVHRTHGGYNSARETQMNETDTSVQKSTRASTSQSRDLTRSSHPLMDEIKRLTAACEAHEREIRVSQTTINRQLQDWSQNFDNLNDIDTQAEKLSATVNQVVSTTEAEHAEKISSIMDPLENRVDEMAIEFAPWNTYIPEEGEEEPMDGGRGSIPRVRAMDGIAKLEKQAEIVRMYYEAEEVRLKALVKAKRSKRNFFKSLCSWVFTAVFAIGVLILALLWMFEWRSDGTRADQDR